MYNCTELRAAKGPQTELALDRTTQQKKAYTSDLSLVGQNFRRYYLQWKTRFHPKYF